MVWPFARSNGGSNSSVAALIAVETNALISAVRAVAVAASMAITMATMRMTIPPRTQLSIARYRMYERRSAGWELVTTRDRWPAVPAPLTVDLRHAVSPAALKRAKASRDVTAWRVE